MTIRVVKYAGHVYRLESAADAFERLRDCHHRTRSLERLWRRAERNAPEGLDAAALKTVLYARYGRKHQLLMQERGFWLKVLREMNAQSETTTRTV